MSRYRIGIVNVVGGASLVAVHVQPGSIVHVDEQPSPFVVLPSSHCSLGNLRPSPHTAVHVPPAHFGSIVHVGEQPSYGIKLPSSHCSSPSTMPLPQWVCEQTLPGHVQPDCTVHVAEHPRFMPLCAPRSHCSLPATTPSPHCLAMQCVSGVGHDHPVST